MGWESSERHRHQGLLHLNSNRDFSLLLVSDGREAMAAAEDVHRYLLWLASSGTSVGTANVSATALRFSFKITLKRRDLAEEVVSTREHFA